jgi:predicted dehydrogenase
MVKRSILNAAIVGAGAIGSRWDEHLPFEQRRLHPITHASAIESLSNCRLIALCDSDNDRLQAACRARSVTHPFADVESMLSAIGDQIDLLVLATPAGQRERVLSWAVGRANRPLIVCEKPAALDIAEARALAHVAQDGGLSVHVPFLRRWVPACQEARQLIVSGKLGPIQKVVATYGKGITNNGSHLFDLLIWFFGEPLRIRATDAANDDRLHEVDPTIGCEVEFSNGDESRFLVHMLATDHRAWTGFECDIMGRHGRIRLTDRCNKLELYHAVVDSEYPGYIVLQREPLQLKEETTGPFAAMYREIEQCMFKDVASARNSGEGGAKLRDALLAQAACAAAKQSYEQGFAKLSFAPFVKEWIDE